MFVMCELRDMAEKCAKQNQHLAEVCEIAADIIEEQSTFVADADARAREGA